MVLQIPLFRHWTSRIYHEYINYIFAFEVAPLQRQIRQDVFELHFLMMVPFCGVAITGMGEQGEKEKNKAVEPIDWGDIVQGRDTMNPPSLPVDN